MDIITYALCKKIAKAAVSGIKNLTINGTDLIIETNDGVQLTMHFPTPKDGISIVNVEINNQNHLICTLSDNSTIDAGEINGIGGGLIQKNKVSQFPSIGKEDTLYLEKDTETLYYWNGTKYELLSEGTGSAKLETAKIEFDGINDTFNLPIDNVNMNVYVNGIYYTEDEDYTIDRTVTPNTITFTEIYEDWESCRITYIKSSNSGESGDPSSLTFATLSDIQDLFKEETK